MQYWLIKSEPETYSLDDLRNEKIGRWDGVRNYTARNNLRAMQVGDICIFYHSVTKPAAVGLAKIVGEAYPDPTCETEKERETWSCVDVEFVSAFDQSVPLKAIKANDLLRDMALLKLSRLSVQPVRPEEFDEILKMSKGKN